MVDSFQGSATFIIPYKSSIVVMVDARVICVGSDTNRTLQTPTVARNTAPSAREERRHSDICLLITDTSPAAATHCDPDNNSIQRRMRLTLFGRRHASGKAGAMLGSCHPPYPLLSAPSPRFTSRQPLDLVLICDICSPVCSAADDPSVSQSVFTIIEKAPITYIGPSPG